MATHGPTWMAVSIICLLSVLQTHVVRSFNNCSGLTVFKQSERVENFTCAEYESEDCPNTDPDHFPSFFLDETGSVDKPRDFKVTYRRVNVTEDQRVSELNFQWKVPLSGQGRRDTKGFYLELAKVGSGEGICTFFDLRQFDMKDTVNMRFEYTRRFFDARDESYRVLLLGLPPPSNEEYAAGLQERTAISVPRIQVGQISLAELRAYVNWESYEQESKIEMKFEYPSWANFTRYRIQLVRLESGNLNTVFDPTVRGNHRVAHNFTNVKSGKYRIQIQPTTEVDGQDQCGIEKKRFGNPEPLKCAITTTEFFDFQSLASTITTMQTLPVTSPSTKEINSTDMIDRGDDHSQPNASSSVAGQASPMQDGGSRLSGSHGVGVVVASSLVPVVAIAFTLSMLWLWKYRRTVHQTCRMLEEPIAAQDNPVFIIGSSYGPVIPRLSRKTVLLLASEDHKYFNQALQSFAAFLRRHCLCDVIFAPEQLDDVRRAPNSYCWLSAKIDSADYVVVVASEAAFRLYQAFQTGSMYELASVGPKGDLFTQGIKHICGKIASDGDVSRVIMVHFDHTSTDYRLPISAFHPCFYLLPSRLKPFLVHIHNLDENTMDLSWVNLPLQGNIGELEGGGEWLRAVSDSAAFEREHPQWFDEKFGSPVNRQNREKPSYTSLTSDGNRDSGFSQETNPRFLQRLPSSVSRQAAAYDFFPPSERNSVYTLPVSDCIAETTDRQDLKDDFFPPSERNSVYTLPVSDCTVLSVIDTRNSTDDKLRKLNVRYEEYLKENEVPKKQLVEQQNNHQQRYNQQQQQQQQQQQHTPQQQQQQHEADEEAAEGPDFISQEGRSISSDVTDYSHGFQCVPYPGPDFSSRDYDRETDSISVSSAQSV